MNSIDLMVEEHVNIRRALAVVRKACYKILKNDEISYEDFSQIIDFIKVYADSHHHGKEEKFLFKEMVDNLGDLGNKLITHGMLIEHDYGRFYIQELEKALNLVKEGDEMSKLDVIANAISYTHLLDRHIEKEDSLVYTFATRHLSPEIMDKVNNLSKTFEEEATDNGLQKHYLDILSSLEDKYK